MRRRGVVILPTVVALVTLFCYTSTDYAFLMQAKSSKSSQARKNEAPQEGQQYAVDSASVSHHCPAQLELNCTDGWIIDGLESMTLLQKTVITTTTSSQNNNLTEFKICRFPNEAQHLMGYSNNGKGNKVMMKSAGHTLPTGGILLKCHNALIEFRTKRQLKAGVYPTVTCGYPMPSSSDHNVASIRTNNISAVLGTDLNWPWTYQHAVKDGLGLSAMIWNHVVKDVPNLHVLVGAFNEPYIHLLGKERIVNAPADTESRGGKMWFQQLYLGTVPAKIAPREWLSEDVRDDMRSVQNSESDLLPCSVASMEGFRQWREEFSSRDDDGYSSPSTYNNSNKNGNKNGTLLYLQRLGRSSTNRLGNFVFSECNTVSEVAPCSCKAVPEEEFIQRLKALASRLNLTLQIFQSTGSRKKDAQTFSQARVVIGPHGGAFTNMLFLDPKNDPIVIESNLHEDFWNCCNVSLRGEARKESPRHFFSPLAASLGVQYVVHQPHIWEGYGFEGQIRLEINDYLRFVENTVRGIDTGMDHVSAPFHPCLPFFH